LRPVADIDAGRAHRDALIAIDAVADRLDERAQLVRLLQRCAGFAAIVVRLHRPGDRVLGNSGKRSAERGDGLGRRNRRKRLALLKQPRGDDLAVFVDDPG
jgi:hypothetical protein